jgi:hypothetical protein
MNTSFNPGAPWRACCLLSVLLLVLSSAPAASAANRYVSPSGNDGNSGTEASPWKTLNYAFSQLNAGDTLWMRGGAYRESGITLSKSGTSSSPIVVANYPGEAPVVDGAQAAFQPIGNTNWELHDSGTQTYRSKSTSFGTGTWRGSFVADDGELYRLFTYASLTHLMSTTYTFVAGGNYYRGPGFVRHTDGRLYIRLQNLSSPRDGGVPAGATGNIKTVPGSGTGFNPASYKVNLSQNADLVTITGDYITFDGIAFENADRTLVLTGADFVDFLSCRIFGHRVGMRIQGGSHNVSVKWSDLDSGHPPYVSWNEIKTSDVATEMKNAISTVAADSHTLTFEDNRFRKYFDGITIVQSGIRDVFIRHNAFDFMFDDGVQFNGSVYNFEFGWNFVNGPGPGYNGGIHPSNQMNKKWWHHNVIDVRRDEFGRRNGEGGDGVNWRLSHRAIPTHSTSGSDEAVKIYNNTFLIEQNINNQGVGYHRIGGTTGVHEVYNNIVVQYHNREYNRFLGTGSQEKYDYQLFYKADPGTFPRFNDFPPSSTDYANLTAWKGSSPAITNGYDQNSREADPQFTSGANPTTRNYRPSSGGPAATGAKNLSTTGWPGGTSASWVGAVNPSASTGLGDVGPRPRSGGGGAGIAFRSASSATTGSSTATSLAVNKPSGVVSGDWMFAGISVSNQDATITAPAGWTLVRTITDTMRLSIYRKQAGGSEPASYTWTSSISRRLCGGIVAFSGVNASTPIQVENGIAEAGSGVTAHSTPTISTSGSSTWLISLFADRTNTGSTWSPPSGTTERVDVRTTDAAGNNPSLAIYTVGPVPAGNKTHTATASNSSSTAGMEIIAIQP